MAVAGLLVGPSGIQLRILACNRPGSACDVFSATHAAFQTQLQPMAECQNATATVEAFQHQSLRTLGFNTCGSACCCSIGILYFCHVALQLVIQQKGLAGLHILADTMFLRYVQPQPFQLGPTPSCSPKCSIAMPSFGLLHVSAACLRLSLLGLFCLGCVPTRAPVMLQTSTERSFQRSLAV